MAGHILRRAVVVRLLGLVWALALVLTLPAVATASMTAMYLSPLYGWKEVASC